MSLTVVAIGFAVFALLAAPATGSAYSMVAVVETQTQGPLNCGNVTPGQEGTQALLGLSEEFAAATTDGARANGPQARPLVVIKELDRCSPPLFQALVGRERITRVEVRLFDKRGVHFFTIRLENAAVIRISMLVRQHGLHEEVAFAFQTIHLIDERTGVSASHDFGS